MIIYYEVSIINEIELRLRKIGLQFQNKNR